MRPPFYMDDLSPGERRAARRMLFGNLFGYTAIILLVFAVVLLPTNCRTTTSIPSPARLSA